MMKKLIGKKESFAFEIGERETETIQIVDIWVGGVLVTDFDNSAYLPSFVNSIEKDLDYLNSEKIPENHVYLNYGPTTDDFVARIEIAGKTVRIDLSHIDKKSMNIKIDLEELIQIYRAVIGELKNQNIA